MLWKTTYTVKVRAGNVKYPWLLMEQTGVVQLFTK